MTRGVLSTYILTVMVAVWIGYLNYINKLELMTQKEKVTKQETEISELRSKEKSYLDAIDVKNHTIMKLEKELAQQKTLNSILQDKFALQLKKNEYLIKMNYEGLKDFRSHVDSLILKNLEESYKKDDGQSRKPETSQQGQAGTKN